MFAFSALVLLIWTSHFFIILSPHLSIRFINNIETRNQTMISEFILLGISDDQELQPLIFSLFLIMYLVTVFGNLLIILAVSFDSNLHNPMYFFLSNLSFTDICVSTTTIPKMLVNIQTQNHSITYKGCINQIFFIIVLFCFENFILAVMAYDRYAAICHPLRYTVIMNSYLCGLLILLSLFISMMNALIHSLMVLHLSFCTDVEIPQFFCELTQVLNISCSNTLTNNILIYVLGGLLAGIPISGIIFSYTRIVSSVLRISTAKGKYKAFSTCGSHLSIVSLFYGTSLGVYFSSPFTSSPKKAAAASVMYIVFPQMINPFIYSLRNKDIKVSLKKLIGKMRCFL
ncbi:PREDICTED: olfactory receptor 7G2-like [Chrysochloris asiatica]|uniref:Olfactory receptor n=1 Tax=Chrysochloris asiatica TaxID=185453 RepID=A0A9B0UBC5_CHRAS|nr:PREDICTED: olfactory receptor 7G2-like [Chrysochloris asiatica]